MKGIDKGGMRTMQCYACAKEGIMKKEAVAVCAVCGMGLCVDHAIEREIPMTQRVSGWASQTMMHILCERCTKVSEMIA